MNDFPTNVLLLCAWLSLMLLFISVVGFIADYIIDDKTGRIRKMRLALLNVAALMLGYLLDKIRHGEQMHHDEHHADDNRPALLKEQAE